MVLESAVASIAQAGKYLSFLLGEEEYGVEILKVQEINGITNITRVPRTPKFIRGVVNLRGRVIPVVDLRAKLGLAVVPDTEKTCVIVVQIDHGVNAVTMGVIVDAVSEVLDISGEEIAPSPSFGAGVDADFIIGMGKLKERVVILLDIAKILTAAEADALAKTESP